MRFICASLGLSLALGLFGCGCAPPLQPRPTAYVAPGQGRCVAFAEDIYGRPHCRAYDRS